MNSSDRNAYADTIIMENNKDAGSVKLKEENNAGNWKNKEKQIEKNTEKKVWKDWHFAFLAFVLSAIAVIIPFSMAHRMFFSNYSIMEGDYFCQEVPFYIETLRKLFHDSGNFWYSFNYSMGSDIFAQYDIFSCLNPFVLFYLIPDANLASVCMIIAKLATAGCCFQIFSSKCLHKTGITSVLFSVAYALCGYNVMFYINVAFLEGVYMLPVICVMLYRLIHQKKWIGLTLSYAYLFINCFYAGYIVGIFSFFVFVLYLILIDVEKRNEKLKCFGRFAWSVLAAVAVSSFILLPTAIYVLENMAPDATQFEGLQLNPLDVLGNLFLGMNQGRMGVMPYIYCGIVVLFTTPCFFIDKKISGKYKIFGGVLLAILLLCCLVDPCYLFMHCFDAPDTSGFRFAYMISFVLLSMGTVVLEHCKTVMTKKAFAIIAPIWILILFAVYFLQQITWEQEYQSMSLFMAEINLILIAVYFAYFFFQNKFKTGKGSTGFFAIFYYLEILFNTYLVLIVNSYQPIEYMDAYRYMMQQNRQVFDEIEDVEGDSFYRSSMNQSPAPNYLMMYNQKGLGSFSTFENITLRDTLTKLGYATSTRLVYDYGGTDFTKMIFDQKYDVYSYCVTYNNLITNPYYTVQDENLGLGFMCDSALYDVELTDNAVKNQNLLLSAMSGVEEPLYQNIDSEIKCDLNNVIYGYSEAIGSNAYVLQDGCEYGEAYYTFEAEDDKKYYCYLPCEDHGKYSNSPIIYSSGGDVGYALSNSYASMPHMLRIGRDENGKYNVGLEIENTMLINYIPVKDIYFVEQNDRVLQDAYEVLARYPLKVEEWKDGYVKGTVQSGDTGNVLFLSIPYEKGWKAYVDGEETAISPVINDTFISLELSQGEHEIELVYTNRYGVIGQWISLGALVIMIISGVYGIRRKKEGIDSEHYEEERENTEME